MNDETPSGKLSEWINIALSEFYVKNLSREVIRGMKYNIEVGKSNGGFDLLGYDGNCGNGYDTDTDFCKELVTRSLPEIKECIMRLLNGDDIPHQTFTDDIEPYKMYEGH
jgi:hypothetical protein